MISCYVLSLMSAAMFLVAAAQRHLGFSIFQANYPTFFLFCVILYLFTQTLIMFFFVGTGVSIKEYTHEHRLDHAFHDRSIKIKRIVYPPQLANIGLFMLAGISLGFSARGFGPGWLHEGIFYLAMLHWIRAFWIQHQCFRENTRVILEMSGLHEEAKKLQK